MFECKICGKEVKTKRGLCNHIHTHNITSSDYIKKYEDFRCGERDNDLVICPICDKYNFKNLLSHVTWKHKMTKEQFYERYPNYQVTSDGFKKQCAIGGHNGLISQQQNQEKWHESRRKAWKTWNERHPEIFDKFQNAAWETASERLIKQWKDPTYREKKINQAKEQHKNGLTEIVVHRSGKVIKHNGYNMRSSWEVKLAEIFEENNIEYLYEPFYVNYIVEEKTKKYYPDFYIEKLNLILEVKPKSLTTDDVVIKKMKASINANFDFQFITEDELFDDLSIINGIIDDYKK